jgi:uncharacterized protein YjiS (DUF1127 family)
MKAGLQTMTSFQKLDQNSLATVLAYAVWTETVPAIDFGSQPLAARKDELRDEIRNVLGRTDSGLAPGEAGQITRALKFAAEMQRASPVQYALVNSIWDALRTAKATYIAPLSDEGAWTAAIRAARTLRALDNHQVYDLGHFSREKAVARAALALESKGTPLALQPTGRTSSRHLSNACVRASTNWLRASGADGR